MTYDKSRGKCIIIGEKQRIDRCKQEGKCGNRNPPKFSLDCFYFVSEIESKTRNELRMRVRC